MRRFIPVMLIVILALSTFAGCGGGNTSKPAESSASKPAVTSEASKPAAPASSAPAQNGAKPANYPTKPIELIVPAAAGAAADVPARALNEVLKLGQPVVVVNRPGASTTLGSAEAAKKPADGYTILWCAPGGFMIQHHILDLTYKVDDFRHIAMTTPVEPLVIVVTPKSPMKSFKDLEAKLKAGDRITFSAANPGSVGHMGFASLAKQIGSKGIEFVPFTGSAEGTTALLGGHIDMFVADLSEVIPRVKSGEYVPLAVFDSKRVPALPNCPSVEEFGYKDMTFAGIKWIAVRKETPEEIVNYIKQQVNTATQDPKYQKFLQDTLGMGMKVMSEEELTKIVADYGKKFGEVLGMLGMKKK